MCAGAWIQFPIIQFSDRIVDVIHIYIYMYIDIYVNVSRSKKNEEI